MDTPADKDDLRIWALRVRAGLDLPPGAWTDAVAAWSPLLGAGTVLIYLPTPDEPDLSRLDIPGRLAVTRTPPGRSRDLSLHLLDSGTKLERHRFGYLQPVAGTPELDPHEIDLAFVPGLAFDRSGTRLGYGAGYYDRLLKNLRPGIPLVGVTHEDLVVTALSAEPHDVRMTHLLTPRGAVATMVQHPVAPFD